VRIGNGVVQSTKKKAKKEMAVRLLLTPRMLLLPLLRL